MDKEETSRSSGELSNGHGGPQGPGLSYIIKHESSLFGGAFTNEREVKKVDETLLAEGEASSGGGGDERQSMEEGTHDNRDHNPGVQGAQANGKGVDNLSFRAAHDPEPAEAERKQQSNSKTPEQHSQQIGRPLIPSILNAWR